MYSFGDVVPGSNRIRGGVEKFVLRNLLGFALWPIFCKFLYLFTKIGWQLDGIFEFDNLIINKNARRGVIHKILLYAVRKYN